MIHAFDTEEAQRYGLHESILLHCLRWWIGKNRAEGRNFEHGRTWTYNSYPAWVKLVPYLSEKQIRTALGNLIAAGVVIKAQLRADHPDPDERSFENWYALAEEDATPCPIGQTPLPHRADPLPHRADPLPHRADMTVSTIEYPVHGREITRAREALPGELWREPWFRETVENYFGMAVLGSEQWRESKDMVADNPGVTPEQWREVFRRGAAECLARTKQRPRRITWAANTLGQVVNPPTEAELEAARKVVGRGEAGNGATGRSAGRGPQLGDFEADVARLLRETEARYGEGTAGTGGGSAPPVGGVSGSPEGAHADPAGRMV